MIIDVEKIKALLADENVSAYGIEKLTGVSRDTISKIRRGDAQIENLSIKNALKLMKYIELKKYSKKALAEN